MAHEGNQLLQLSSSDESIEETKSVSSHSVYTQTHGTDENVVISDAETENFSIQSESMRTSDKEKGSQSPNSVYTQTVSTDESTGTSDTETEDVATPSVSTQPHAAVYHHGESKMIGRDLKTKLEGTLKEQISNMVPNYDNRNAIKSDSETEDSSSEQDSLFLSEASEIDEEFQCLREISTDVVRKLQQQADSVNKSDALCENLFKDTKYLDSCDLSIYLHSNETLSDDKQLGVVQNFIQSCEKLKETEQTSDCRDSSISPHEPSASANITGEREIKQIYSLDENRVIEVVVDKGTQSCKNFETREYNLNIDNAALPLKKIINKRYFLEEKQLEAATQSRENLQITEHTPETDDDASLLSEKEVNKQLPVNRTESRENFETSEHSRSLPSTSRSPRSTGAIKKTKKKKVKGTSSLTDNKQLKGASNRTLSFENFETSEQSSELQDKSLISEKNINEISLSDNEQLAAKDGSQSRENSETSERSRSLRSTSRSPRSTGAIKKTKKKKVKKTYSHVRFVRTSPGKSLYLKFKYNEEKYICEICNKSFKSFSKIKNHLHRNERVNLFPCTFCKKLYSTEKWFEVHLAKCRRNLSCQNCRVEFTTLENKKKHTCVKETAKELSCDEEGFKIPSHIHWEEVSVDYEDNVHTKGYGSEHSEDHEKINEQSSKTVVHDECRGDLETKNNCSVNLKDEKKVNVGNLSPTDSTKLVNSQDNSLYTCDDCSECLKNPALKMHSCSHSFEQIYVCDECGEKFDEREEIILHIFSHTADKS